MGVKEIRDADIMILSLGEQAVLPGLQLAEMLRQSFGDLRIKADFTARSMKAQMRGANKANARLVLIRGENELADGTIGCKLMETSEQVTIKMDELHDFIVSKLSI